MSSVGEGIKRAGNNLTGEAVKEGLETLKDFDTGGIVSPVTFIKVIQGFRKRKRMAVLR